MNGMKFFGMVVGILAGVLFGVFLLSMARKDKSAKAKFDERQEIVRGKAFKCAYFTLLVYQVLDAFVLARIDILPMEDSLVIATGIFVSVLVFAVYSIWNEGYFSLNEEPKKVLWIFAFICLINLAIAFMNRDSLMVDGKLTLDCLNLFVGVVFAIIYATVLVRWLVNKKQDEMDGDE